MHEKPTGQESAKHPGQNLFTKLEKKQQTKKPWVCLASVASFLQTTLEILSSGLGLNTVKWVFSQLPELFQCCQRRGMCDRPAMLGFVSDGEES